MHAFSLLIFPVLRSVLLNRVWYLALQFEIRVKCIQHSKASGFVRNRKREQLVATAVIASSSISDEHVSLPATPDQPALVTSQEDSATRYKVQNACMDTASCSCPVGTLGSICKHVVKVISLMTNRSGPDIVLALGTWAGSNRGGVKQLLQRDSSEQVYDSFRQLTECFQLEDEAQEHEKVQASSSRQDSSRAPRSDGTDEEAILAHVRKLLEQTKDKPDMRGILASKLNQAEASINQVTARNLPDLSYPAAAIDKVKDGLPDSRVRLKSFVEAGHRSNYRGNRTASTDVSGLPPAVPFSKPKPDSKKRTFRQVLQAAPKPDQENNSAAANQAVNTDPDHQIQKQSKPAAQPKARRCGTCKTCLNPRGKKGCLTNAAAKPLALLAVSQPVVLV